MDSRIEALRRVPLFAELGEDDLQCVADAVNEALRSSQSLMESKLGPALGGLHGLGLPGL